MSIMIYQVDYQNPKHGADLISLLNYYALGEMGGGQPLQESVKQTLVSNLAKFPGAISLLVYDEDEPIGLLNAFEGFSTFANEPLINIHDVVVVSHRRGEGIAQQLLAAVEEIAKVRSCCKLTLEVLCENEPARSVYRKCGFEDYCLGSREGQTLFWQKKLS